MLRGATTLCLEKPVAKAVENALALNGLARVLHHATKHAERFELPELYKLGILLKDPVDILGLHANQPLLRSLRTRYHELRDAATPFQVSLLDAVLPSSPSSTSLNTTDDTSCVGVPGTSSTTTTTAAPVTAQEYFKAIMDMVREVEAEHNRAAAKEGRPNQWSESSSSSSSPSLMTKRAASSASSAASSTPSSVMHLGETLGADRASSLEKHLSSLEPHLRQLSPKEVIQLVKTLAKLNYTNYDHTVLLTRRSCEVAGQLQRRDLCTLFHNLVKLHSRDSLVPIVNRIVDQVQEVTGDEVLQLCQSLERQANNSSASQRLLLQLIPQALKKLPDASTPVFHRTLMMSMARYNIRQPDVVRTLLRDWAARFQKESSEKDVLNLFEAAVDLTAASSSSSSSAAQLEGVKELIDRLTFLAPSIGIWSVDRAMDLLSTVPMEQSTACMNILMKRLEDESGTLSVGQLKSILHLLSTYPPARGQVAIVSLAYASAVRAKAMDAETLESILLSLAMLHLFTDDFYAIAQVLQLQKGGMRRFSEAQTLLECCTPEMAATAQGLGMLSSVILTLAPVMNDEEVLFCRKALAKLGVTERDILQRLFADVKRAQRKLSGRSTSRKRRGGYRDPMEDLL